MRRRNKYFFVFLLIAIVQIFGCAGAAKKNTVSTKDGHDIFEDKAPIIQDQKVEQDQISVESTTSTDNEKTQDTKSEHPAEQALNDSVRICIVLGPGMARGFAHAGVLEAILDANIKPYCILGIEMGAVVGALYAQNLNTNTMQWQLSKIKKENYLDTPLFSFKGGVVSTEKIGNFFHEVFASSTLKDLKIPFATVLTNADTGAPFPFYSEPLVETLSAAIALPNIFEGKSIQDKGTYASGATSSPLPIREALDMGATHVIVVDLLMDNFSIKKNNKLEMEIAKQFIIAKNLSKLQKSYPSTFIITPDLRRYFFTDFEKRAEIISVGKRSAQEIIAKIIKLISASTHGKEGRPSGEE